MTWKCFLVDKPVPPDQRKPGMMWFANWYIERDLTGSLSPNYRRDWMGKRAPVVIVLPDGDLWCPDRCPSWGSNVEDGWAVTGAVPDLAATPSISTSGYHGFLRGGFLTDDVEGRVFPMQGSTVTAMPIDQKGQDTKPDA